MRARKIFQRVEVEHGFAYQEVTFTRFAGNSLASSFTFRQRFVTIAVEQSVGYISLQQGHIFEDDGLANSTQT